MVYDISFFFLMSALSIISVLMIVLSFVALYSFFSS